MAHSELTELPPAFPVGTDIVPFTTRWGGGLMGMIEQMRYWIDRTLVPHVNKTLREFIGEINADMDRLNNSVNSRLSENESRINVRLTENESLIASRIAENLTVVTAKLEENATAVDARLDANERDVNARLAENLIKINDAVDQVINSSIEVQDPVVRALLDDPQSDTRVKANQLYAKKDVEASVAANTAEIADIGPNLSATDANATRLGLLRSVEPPTGLNAQPFRRLWAGIASRGTKPLVIALIGDSNGLGVGAGGNIFTRFIMQLVVLLRLKYPTTGLLGGGRGFLSTSENNLGPVRGNAATSSGGTSAFSPDATQTAVVNGTYKEWDIDATGADILYQPATGGGAFRYQVDGGAWTTVDTNFAYANKLERIQLRNLGESAHVVRVEGTTAAAAKISGVVEYKNDALKGVLLFAAAIAGTGTTFWVNAIPARWTAWMPVYNPDAVYINLLTNNFINAAAKTSAATFKSEMQTIIAGIKAANTVVPSIFLLVPPVPKGTGNIDPWSDYKTALYSIAADDPQNIAVIDYGYIVNPLNVSSTADGLIGADEIHLTERGHAMVAKLLLNASTPV